MANIPRYVGYMNLENKIGALENLKHYVMPHKLNAAAADDEDDVKEMKTKTQSCNVPGLLPILRPRRAYKDISDSCFRLSSF